MAVLDFQNLSRDTADDYLAEGLAEELTTRLGQVERLSVTSRAVVRRLPNVSATPIPALGRTLGVSYLVNGSVRRSGSRLRVNVELLRAANGVQAWASQYDRGAADVLAIQEDVATAVATAIAGRLLPAERATLAARPTTDPAAYDQYLRGMAYRRRALSGQGVLLAIAEFERAVATDSTFALAWAELGATHARAFHFYLDRSEERLVRARAAADRAVGLAPTLAEGYLARGFIHYWGRRDYARALEEFSSAQRHRPGTPEVLLAISWVKRRQGRFEESLADSRQALDRDPTDHTNLLDRALTLVALGRYDEAEGHVNRALALAPEYVDATMAAALVRLVRDGDVPAARDLIRGLAGRTGMGALADAQSLFASMIVGVDTLIQQAAEAASLPGDTAGRLVLLLLRAEGRRAAGRSTAAAAYDSSRVLLEGLVRRRPLDHQFRAQLALAYAGTGRKADALREAARAVELLPVSLDAFEGPTMLMNQAMVMAMTGELDPALEILERLVDQPGNVPVTRQLLRVEPRWAMLRGNPRFERLVARP